MKKWIIFVFFGFLTIPTFAQGSFWFGPKFGPSIGTQVWNGLDQQPLLASHAAFFLESFADEDDSGTLFAQLGYHVRGSSLRQGGVIFDVFSTGFEFRNASLLLGAKRFIPMESKNKAYYLVGARLEYTLSTNLKDFENSQFATFYPFDAFVNKWNYGLTIGAGYSIPLSEKIGVFVEATIHPDLSYQYQQPALGNVVVPSPFGGSSTLSERQIRNLSLEVSIGFNFLRKVVYVD